MNDQAEKLRNRVKRQMNGHLANTLAIISGKGGVGKSNIALNFAIALSKHRKKVLLFDLDIGMGNIELLIGENSNKSIADFLIHENPLDQIIQQGPEGMHYIAGGSGLNSSVILDDSRIEMLLKELNHLLYEYDYIIFDIGAGMTEELVQFLSSVNDVIVVVTPEPTSIMDAYSAMKLILLNVDQVSFHLLGNRMKNEKENRTILLRLQNALSHFLKNDSEIVGFIPEDASISTAVKRQIPFSLYKPHSNASKQISLVAKYFLEESKIQGKQEEHHFINKLKHLLLRK